MTAAVTHSGTLVLVVAVFLASAVEMVEALTIVLAVGVTRGWRSALEGVAVALVVLAAWWSAFGPALVHLRTAVGAPPGGRVACCSSSGCSGCARRSCGRRGCKAKHDEDAIFAEHVAELSDARRRQPGATPPAFVVAFKGVFLEGLEVVVVVLTLGTTSHRPRVWPPRPPPPRWWWSAIVGSVRGTASSPAVPENAMKMARRADAGQLRDVLGRRGGARRTGPAPSWPFPVLVAVLRRGGLGHWCAGSARPQCRRR